MSRIYDYSLSTPGSDVQIVTDDVLSSFITAAGIVEGYAVQGVSGQYDDLDILGLIGVGGAEQTAGPYVADNTIFDSDHQGVGGSIAGFDNEGVAFATSDTVYDLHSAGGALLDGVNGNALGLYDSSFYVDGSQGADTLVGTGSTNFIDTDSTAGGGDVTVNLTDGYVINGDVLDADLENIQGVQLGDEDSTVLGLASGVDLLYGGSGTDTYYGNGADDYIQGGTGLNYVVGGSGNEVFYSGGGADAMTGGTAGNFMVGGTSSSDSDTFYGNGGADYVYGEGGTITLYGSSGQDYLSGGSGYNELIGSNQSDGFNVLQGDTQSSQGTDLFYGGIGTNLMYEGAGTDVFAGGSGIDEIYGGTGRSFVYGGSGQDVVTTGAGDQYVQAGSGATFFNETAANMTAGRFDQIDNFTGGQGTFLYLPTAAQNNTSFVQTNGGTAVLTAVNGGTSEIFASNTSVSDVIAHTNFTL